MFPILVESSDSLTVHTTVARQTVPRVRSCRTENSMTVTDSWSASQLTIDKYNAGLWWLTVGVGHFVLSTRPSGSRQWPCQTVPKAMLLQL